MIVAFASLRRCYGDAPLVLFSDRMLPDPYRSQLIALRVETRQVEGKWVHLREFHSRFPGCLYTLDVLSGFTDKSATGLFLIDPDFIVRRPIPKLIEAVQNGNFCTIEIDYDIHRLVNGQSRLSLSLAAAMCGVSSSELPIRYYGGEFYGVPVQRLGEFVPRMVAASKYLQLLASHGSIHVTEEHILSIALALTEPKQSANSHVKRIWTVPSCCNWASEDAHLPMWHLPGEKNRAFDRLYRSAASIPEMTDEQFDALLAQNLRPVPPALLRIAANARLRFTSAVRILVG